MFILASPETRAFCPAMLFWLKKSVSFWLMPLPFCLTLLVAGLLLSCGKKWARLGRALLVAGTALLLILSNKLVSQWLINPLETRYSVAPAFAAGEKLPPALKACRFVVVLGAGHTNAPGRVPTLKLSDSALSRITEAARILRALPEAKLIVSGPAEPSYESHATVLARSAESLGIARDRILYIDNARDTEDESNAVKKFVGETPTALVTSAWHMPRSMALFHHAGVNAVPCPADFKGRPGLQWREFDWDIASLDRSTCAVRERIGYLWIWLRGKT